MIIRKAQKESLESLLQSIFTAQVLALATRLRMQAAARGDTVTRDYELKAVRLIKSAKDAVMSRWRLDLPEDP